MFDAVEHRLEDENEDFDYEEEEDEEEEEEDEDGDEGETWQVRGPGQSLDFSATNSL